jgi:hypothetical protein
VKAADNGRSYGQGRFVDLLSFNPPGGLCGLLSAKGGLMMGTKKVGALSSPRKKAKYIIHLVDPKARPF